MNNTNGRFKDWISSSTTFKVILIAILMLLLLIPASMIHSVINERESLNRQAIQEVSEKWANGQSLSGPVLTIPYEVEYSEGEETKTYQREFHVLPEVLTVNGEVRPKELYRGIYKVVVYESGLEISGQFDSLPDIPDDHVSQIFYDRAFFTIGISDLRGIEEVIDFAWMGKTLEVQPGSKITNLIYSGITLPVDVNEWQSNPSKQSFAFELDMKGSQTFSFCPMGATTEMKIQSPWSSPSFVGNFLPDEREVSSDGFEASWKVLQLNRPFPQSFVGDQHSGAIAASSMGVDFLIPMDDYQKSIRSVKYAGMTIALTFLIFFLVELLNRKKIHPLQYTLVGLALCLFYIMLVAISEHLTFNTAFLISAVAIVAMIGLYSLSVFAKRQHSLILVLCLIAVYIFLFSTIQLQDYALLLGCIGLFITLSLTMYFTRKVDWYNDRQ